MERIGIPSRSDTERPFHVSFEAGAVGSFELSPDVLSVRVAQRVLRAGIAATWNSVSIFGEQEPGGAIVIRVMIFNPDWDGPVQIAALRSWPDDPTSLTVLGCNLDHVVP